MNALAKQLREHQASQQWKWQTMGNGNSNENQSQSSKQIADNHATNCQTDNHDTNCQTKQTYTRNKQQKEKKKRNESAGVTKSPSEKSLHSVSTPLPENKRTTLLQWTELNVIFVFLQTLDKMQCTSML